MGVRGGKWEDEIQKTNKPLYTTTKQIGCFYAEWAFDKVELLLIPFHAAHAVFNTAYMRGWAGQQRAW